jgi:hypothetical protein
MKEFPAFLKTQNPFPCSQDSAAFAYPEPAAITPRYPSPLLEDPF